ncbi:MAG TPA: DUF5985 family protein [Phenylobacterium sp.]|jgi:membrane-associated PAP2 superfamily phosphatase|nr:DUF5985 family protein [Phenylobacterium sp.]
MTVNPQEAWFVTGVLTAGFVIVGLYFLRFWVVTRDTLFAAFAVAFWLMGLNQIVSMSSRVAHAENSAAYLIRLAAFLLIILAVLNKNTPSGSSR